MATGIFSRLFGVLGDRGATGATVAFVIVFAVVTCFGQLFLHPADILTGHHRAGNNDLTAEFVGFREYPGLAIDRFGELPMWNPYSQFGTPFVGNPQSSTLYPPNWIFWVGNTQRTISWVIVAHHLWAAAGIYFLCRRFDLDKLAAAGGFACSVAAPFLAAQSAEGHFNQICVVAWIPWAFLAYENFRAGKTGSCLLMALVIAMSFLAGHAQEVYYLVLVLSGFVVVDMLQRLRGNVEGTRSSLLSGWILVGCLVLGFVAADLLQIFIYTQNAVRSGGIDLAQGGIGMRWSNLAQLFYPWALGGPDDYSPEGMFFWESICYFGVLPLLLALLGIIRNGHRYPVPRYAVLLVLTLLFALGSAGPLFPVLHRVVPGLSFFRVPSRALFFSSFVVAFLAAFGVDVILKMLRSRSSGWANRSLRPVATVVMLACSVELAFFANQLFRTIPPESFRNENPVAALIDNEDRLTRIMARQDLISDREAWTYGLHKVQAYEPVPLTAAVVAIDAATDEENIAEQTLGFVDLDLSKLNKPAVDMLGVRYAAVGPQAATTIEGWELISRGNLREHVTVRGATPRNQGYLLFENQSPLPRAYVVGEAKTIASGQDHVAALSSIDPRTTVLLEQDVLGTQARSDFQPARIVEYSSRRVAVEVELERPGYLVLTDTYYPGWSATDNGRPTEVLRANVAFRGVALQPGQHRVEFSYQPPAYGVGLAATLLTMVLASISVLRRFENAAISDPA